MNRNVIHLETETEVERVLLLHRHKGLLQRVAERCGVHPSLVSRVFHGKARSARVEKELEKALLKLRTPPPKPRSQTFRFTKPIDRSREAQWLADHRQEYAGKWVALDGYRLVANGDHAKQVFAAARRSGASPIIEYVEPSGPVLLWW